MAAKALEAYATIFVRFSVFSYTRTVLNVRETFRSGNLFTKRNESRDCPEPSARRAFGGIQVIAKSINPSE